jgi:hypothetical protein
MEVEIKPFGLMLTYRHGQNTYTINQPYDQARVFVDGEQVGLTMVDPKDPNFRVLHPLSKGYPKEFLQMVVDNSNGELRATLNGPVPMEDELDEFEGED